MRAGTLTALLTGTVMIGGAPTVTAQQEIRLIEAEAAFPESFSTVRGLIELEDGRLLLADGLGQALMVVDLDAGTADTIGRVGGGPQEYRTPDGLFRLPYDRMLLVDLGNGRLTIVNSDLTFEKTFPIMSPSSGPGFGGMVLRLPQGVDGKGRIYFQQRSGMRPGGELPDSAAIARWDPETDVVDTIGMVKLEERKVSTSGGANNMNTMISAVPLSPRDGWAVAWDGRVATARATGYRMEWVQNDGRVVSGPDNAYDPVKIGTPEKEEWVERLGRNGLSISIMMDDGRRQTQMSRGGPLRGSNSIDGYEWPDYMPAFDAPRVTIDPEGMAWVRRNTKRAADPVYDVFDDTGRLVKQVIFPHGREIVGFGNGVVYTSTADEFDLIWLERFKIET